MVTEISKGRDTTVPCFCGLSTDSKPTDAGNGAEFKEIDTGDTYYFNEAGSTWVKWTGGSGGGGGSSDFSIATITVYNPNSNAFYMYVPNVYGGVMYNSVGKDDISEPVDIVLYNGRATADLTGVGLFSDATGDITLDGTTRAIITGDGTITIS